MFKFKKLRFYLISALLIAAGLVLMFNKILVAGLVVIGIAVFVFLLWELFLKEKEKQIDALNHEIQRMKAENSSLKEDIAELSNRKLNISEINNILDLGLIEVDTNFKRTVNREMKEGDKTILFIGVLHVDFVAKYGVDFRKLLYKVDEARKEICIANANPQFLSFSKRNCVWEIAEILEYNKPFFGTKYWKTNPKLDKLANQIKEEVRQKTERETENGPSELDWIFRPLKKHVETAISLIVGIKGYNIRFTELDGDNYRPMTDFPMDNVSNQLPEQGKSDKEQIEKL
jgi:cell division protein FtsL